MFHFLAAYLFKKFQPHLVLVRGGKPARQAAFRAAVAVLSSKFTVHAAVGVRLPLIFLRYPAVLLFEVEDRPGREVAEFIQKQGTVILEVDARTVQAGANCGKVVAVRYGVNEEGVQLSAVEIVEHLEERKEPELGGIHFKLLHEGSAVPVHLRNVFGIGHIQAALAGAAVGQVLGMNMVEISRALLQYRPPPGQMRLIAGVKRTYIIDDTDDAAVPDMAAALQTLGHLPLREGVTRYAVLGDFGERGNSTESEYRAIGRVVAAEVDVLVGIGVNAVWMVEEAVKNGLSKDRAFHFHTLEEGVEHFLQERIKPGDVLFIKGSPGMRLEKLVKGLMAEPLRAKELLCRQD